MTTVKLDLTMEEATALLLLADRPEDERREILKDRSIRRAGKRAIEKLNNARAEHLRIYRPESAPLASAESK